MNQLYRKGMLLLAVWITLFTAHAQQKVKTDSLMTVKTVFKTNEAIGFVVKLNKKSKKGDVRLIETMSCSCSNTDFYYIVYQLHDPKKGSKNTEFRNHTEKPDTERCTCKVPYAEFHHGDKRSIDPINKSGFYIIQIEGYGFKMYSNVFEVRD